MKVYLAGPDVFLPDAVQIAARKKDICRQHGLNGLFPLDNEIHAEAGSASLAHAIYGGNTDMMDQADAIIANLTPFRGPSADAGTVFELGYMIARGKICLGYSNDNRGYKERIAALCGIRHDPANDRWSDANGHFVENFDLADNLMIVEALQKQGHPLVVPESMPADPWHDLALFETCAARLSKLNRMPARPKNVRAL